MAHSQALKNAMKELNRRRNRAGIDYKSPAPVNVASVPQLPPVAFSLVTRWHDAKNELIALRAKYPYLYSQKSTRKIRNWLIENEDIQRRYINLEKEIDAIFDEAKHASIDIYKEYRKQFPQPEPQPEPKQILEPITEPETAVTIRHYADIGIAAHKQNLTSAYRVFLAIQHLDTDGSGQIDKAHVREQLTGIDSPLWLFTWRRLRQILHAGEGIFWTTDNKDRLWFGAAKVAAALGLGRLTGQPMLMPLETITKGIGAFNAHLFDSWHGARSNQNPISQETLKEITSIPERTQYHYCQVENTTTERNLYIGGKVELSQPEHENHFTLHDKKGLRGNRGQRYYAHCLPNSYQSQNSQANTGRKNKINRKLKDLVINVGEEGASTSVDASSLLTYSRGNGDKLIKMYFTDVEKAVKVKSKNYENDIYVRTKRRTKQGTNIWGAL